MSPVSLPILKITVSVECCLKNAMTGSSIPVLNLTFWKKSPWKPHRSQADERDAQLPPPHIEPADAPAEQALVAFGFMYLRRISRNRMPEVS
jgi:hypothetical protein